MAKKFIGTRKRMGRSIVDHDPRNKDYPTRGFMFQPSDKPQEKVWRGHYAWDQGETSHCVAFSGKSLLNRLPFSAAYPYWKRSEFSTTEFYVGAQNNDEWEGMEPDYYGTSGRGLLRYLRAKKIIREARWNFGLNDLILTVSNYGPCSVGTWWSDSMFYPERFGNRLVYEQENRNGGHQWTVIGVHPYDKEFEMINSWGLGWGINGRARVSYAEMEKLLADDGDSYTFVTI